jgi:hypothetical protein
MRLLDTVENDQMLRSGPCRPCSLMQKSVGAPDRLTPSRSRCIGLNLHLSCAVLDCIAQGWTSRLAASASFCVFVLRFLVKLYFSMLVYYQVRLTATSYAVDCSAYIADLYGCQPLGLECPPGARHPAYLRLLVYQKR